MRGSEVVHFNSDDLEHGNPGKRLTGATGAGTGEWRLVLDTSLDIEVLAYVRTFDGFLTTIHELAVEADRTHYIPTFNPGRNVNQQSVLRLINQVDEPVHLTIRGFDDQSAASGQVTLTLPARGAVRLTAAELEAGPTAGLDANGALGVGSGKWRLFVEADQPIYAMSLLASPNGHLANLSRSRMTADEVFVIVAGLPSAGSGQPFVDTLASGGDGPEMLVIPGGSFRMGCLNDDGECERTEFPVHTVKVPAFALSRSEVTFDQWDACVDAGGCGGHSPHDSYWGRGDRPVMDVTWHHAQSYVAWLSEQTGEEYRLASEAEWEYAARAGTETRYSWGDEIGENRAVCSGCGSRWDRQQTAPVGSFEPNPWGLYDMHGNVWEWTEDCHNRSYEGAPDDGSAWTAGDCSFRMARGGSWLSQPVRLRAMMRVPLGENDYNTVIGFRVARTLHLRRDD